MTEEFDADLEEIEKLLKQNNEELKEFNKYFVSSLKEDMYVDVMDKVKIWRSGKIVRRKDKIAEVGFEGWTKKWNETKKLNTGLVLPFRAKISGYSGPKKRKITDVNFIQKLLVDMMEVEQGVLSKQDFFANCTPEEIVYDVRGRLFYVYNMLFMVEKSLGPDYLAPISNSLNSFVGFLLRYLDEIKAHIPIYLVGRSKEKLFYYVNKEIGIVCSAPEIFELFESCMGISTRSRRIFLVNNFPEKKDFDILYAGNNKLSLPKSNQLLNMFLNGGGYDKFIDLIGSSWLIKHKEESMEVHLPAKLVFLILTTTRVILTKVEKNHMKIFTDKIIKVMNSFFKNLNDFDVQYNLLENYLKCLKYYYTFHANFPVENSATIIDVEEAAILINLKYLSCKIFERKYQGIQLLVSRLKSIKDEKEKEKKREFLLKNKILEILYIKGYHKAVAEKSVKLLEFLAPSLDSKTLIFLLDSSFAQSDEKASVICTTIKQVIKHLNLDIVNDILQKLKKIESSKIRPETIELVLEIIIESGKTNSVFNFYKNRKEAKKAFEQALKFLWKCLENADQLTSSTVNTVLYALMNQVSNLSEKLKLVDLCLEDVANGTIKTQHIILLDHIMESLSSKKSIVSASDFDKLLDRIYEQVRNFTLRMVEEFIKRTADDIVEDHFIDDQIFNTRIKMLLKLTFKGKPKNDTKSAFEELIRFLTSDQKYKHHLDRLLLIIENKPIINRENSSIFFNIFESNNDVLNTEHIDINIYKAFERLFIALNFEIGALQRYHSQRYFTITKQEKLIHVNTLWKICLGKTLPKKVKDKFFELLISCYFRAERRFEAAPGLTAWNQFISDAKEKKDWIKKAKHLGNLAYAFSKAIDLCLGVKYLESNSNKNVFVDTIVKNEYLDIKKTYRLPYNASLNLVRLKIKEDLHLQEADIHLTLFNNKLRYDHIELYSVGQALEHKKEQKPDDTLILGLQVEKEGVETPYTLLQSVKNKLANDSLLTDLFFENIDSEPEGSIWKLLISLPKNKRRTDELLKISNIENLQKLIAISSPRISLYNLSTIFSSLDSESLYYEKPVYSRFRTLFLQEQGFLIFMNMIIAINFKNLEDKNKITAVTNGIFKILNLIIRKQTKFEKAREEIMNFPQFKDYLTNSFKILQALLQNFENEEKEFHLKNIPITMTHITHLMLINNGSITDVINWGELYKEIFIDKKNEDLKSTFSESLKNFLKKLATENVSGEEFIVPLYQEGLQSALENPKNSIRLLEVIISISAHTQNEKIISLNKEHFNIYQKWNQMFEILKNCKSSEEDIVAMCLDILTISVKSEGEAIQEWVNENESDLNELLQICAVRPDGKQIQEPLCSSKKTSEAFYKFLISFLNQSPTSTQTFFEYFENLVKMANWRTGQYKDWNNKVTIEGKKLSKYAGLKNLGCICYMNSVFQQLFMISDFRDYIISSDVKKDDNGDFQSNTLFQFQLIMKSLRDVSRKYHSPGQFCRHFKNFDGSSINVLTQMDADEFLNNLLDKIENELKRAEQGDVIKRTFGGEIVQEIICKDHDYRSERATPFLALPLDVRGNINLKQCLDKYVAGEMLEGENQYFCDDLDKKVDALKRECIKRLPNVLIIVLKRFSFNYENMQKVKINDFCEFPEKLDMSKYTQEFLNNGEVEKSQEYYNYNLRGVVIHKGSANSGHYYSFIRDGKEKWLEFNDTIVRDFDYKNMPSEAYGDNNSDSKQNKLTSDKLKGTNAYMLFYERSSLFDEERREIPGLLQGFVGGKKDEQNIISEEILIENFEHNMKKVLLDNTFADFVCDTLEQISFENLIENEVILRVGFSLFMKLLMRKSQKEKIPRSYKILVKTLSSSRKVARWFLKNTCNSEFIDEFLLDCIVLHMKYFSAGLVKVSIKKLSENINRNPDNNEESEILDNSEQEIEDNLDEETSEDLKLLKNLAALYMYKAFTKKNNSNTKFMKQIYEILGELSTIPQVRDSLSSIFFPEYLMLNLSIGNFDSEDYPSIEGKIDTISIKESIFEGYLGSEIKSEIISIEDLHWKRKGEDLIKRDFKDDYSHIFFALANILKAKMDKHSKVMNSLFSKNFWKKIIVNVVDRKCSFAFCDFFTNYVLKDSELCSDIVGGIQLTMRKNLEIERAGFFYILKKIADSDLGSENHSAEKVSENSDLQSLIVLNVFTELLNIKNINIYFDTYLMHFFYLLKGNRIMFDKVNHRGGQFLDQIERSIDKFISAKAAQLEKESKASRSILSKKDKKKMLVQNKKFMINRLQMVRDGLFEEFQKDFNLDYQFILDPKNLKEVDYRKDDEGWKLMEVGENLGVMLRLDNFHSSGQRTTVRWVESDDKRLAYPNTASVELKFNPTFTF